MKNIVLSFIAILLISITSYSDCNLYTSPDATVNGVGSYSNPLKLERALDGSLLTAGQTLCLKGGTYTGRYVSNVSGTQTNPVTIKSAPNEWARIDGNFAVSLTAVFSATDNYIQVSDSSGLPPANEVFTAVIDNEILRIYGRTGNTLTVYDRRPSTDPNGASNHAVGASLKISSPIFSVNGDYTVLRDFEVFSSSPDRISLASERGAGINTTVRGTKIINMVIHDTGHPAIGFWQQVGDGGEMYGTLVWACGTYDNGGSWTRGSAVYTQNELGTRYLKNNIAFRNFTTGLSMFTTNGYADGFYVKDNIVFDHQNGQNIFVGSQNINPIQRLKVISNYGYQRPDSPQTDLGLGYTAPNVDAEVTDNYFVSNNVTVGIKNFTDVLFTRNTLYLRPGNAQALLGLEQVAGVPVNYTINNNAYYGDNRFTAIVYNGIMDFTQWRTLTGYDMNSTYSPNAPPDTYKVIPNQYEVGRANIVVYNWTNAPSVAVDLSSTGLVVGQSYEIRDAQNYFGAPVVVGTYDGNPVSLPMNLTTISPVIGNVTHINNVHTPSEFSAFVVLPILSPTAVTVSVSGKVVTANNSPINQALVTITNNQGVVKSSYTNLFGSFKIENIEIGQTYIVEVKKKGINFTPQLLEVDDTITNLLLVGN